jgi:DNA gyrase subunit B
MPQIIERGHLFIAQPPLYRVTKGKSQQYLKDERALENYLIDAGLEGATLRLDSGEERAGPDLRTLVEETRIVRLVLGQLHTRYDRAVVEQAAIAGALRPQLATDTESAEEVAAYIARRLDAVAEETERGWQGRPEGGGFVFTRMVRGVKQAAALDAALLASSEARKLDELAASLQANYTRPAMLSRRGETAAINGPVGLFDAVTGIGRKGLGLQRYKGLGEMNPEQLWETTLDRNIRSLLQVKVKEVDEADDIFIRLMGDVVEPRREFIQANALTVANLDV